MREDAPSLVRRDPPALVRLLLARNTREVLNWMAHARLYVSR